MRQQINLFQSVLIDKREPLQLQQVKLILWLFLGLLAVLSLLGYWQLYNANQQATALQQQRSDLAAQVDALALQYPERQKSALLEQELQRTKATIEGQKTLLGYFSQRNADDNSSMLQVLEGLARHRSQGVWLRRIQLGGAGRQISLEGSAQRPEQVPQYLQSLGEKKILGGKVFSHLSLKQLEQNSGQVDFSLESLAEEQL